MNRKNKQPSLFERSKNREEYRENLRKRIIIRAEKELEKGNLQKAISRFQGFCNLNPTDRDLQNRLGSLYLKTGDKLSAGRHLYLKNGLTAAEETCVQVFKKRYGNCPLDIAKKLVYKQNYSIHELDEYSKKQYAALLIAIKEKFGLTPAFLLGMRRHLVKAGLLDA